MDKDVKPCENIDMNKIRWCRRQRHSRGNNEEMIRENYTWEKKNSWKTYLTSEVWTN